MTECLPLPFSICLHFDDKINTNPNANANANETYMSSIVLVFVEWHLVEFGLTRKN